MFKPTKVSIFFLTVSLALMLGSAVLAQEEPTATPEATETEDQPTDLIAPSPTTDTPETTGVVEEVTLDETVTPEELGVEEPNLLPDSKFYFLKNWGRALKSAVTFNPVKKAELKLKYTSERLLEATKLADKNKRPEILQKAAEKYQAEIEKLKQATDKIKETAAENPKVGEFLNKFVKQQILHEKILDKLEEKVPEGALQKIKEAREKHLERFGEVMQKLEDKTKIKTRLENALQNIKGSDFKNIKEMQILKRIEEKLPEEIKEKVMEVREEKLNELKEKITEMAPQAQEKLQNYIEKIKGNEAGKMEILEDINQKLQDVRPEIKERLEQTRERILERVKERTEEQSGLKCRVSEVSPRGCRGRVVIERDEQGCPVPRCVEVAEEEPSSPPSGQDTTEQNTGRAGIIKEQIKERVCVTLWDPVCAENGKTYGNACRAQVAGVEVAYKGACKEAETSETPSNTPSQSPAPIIPRLRNR